MGKRIKYTTELLEPLVKESISFRQVAIKLGKRGDGNGVSYLAKMIRKLKIDITHFLGQGANYGNNHKGGFVKKKPQEILVIRSESSGRESACLLRRALIKSEVEYQCEGCQVMDTWQGKEIRLTVHHKNGEWWDNRLENLVFLCPNCHSQTEGFCGSKGRSGLTSKHVGTSKQITDNLHKCNDCGNKISRKSKLCKRCCGKRQPTKIQWPETKELCKMVEESSYLAVSKLLGVSDNAVRKRLKNH